MSETPPVVFANWPNKFIYVCSAGGAAFVNWAPMMQAGKDSVAAVVVLCAVSNVETPTQADLTHALAPAERLRDYAVNALGLNEDNFEIIYGHPDRFGDWQDVLNKVYDKAKAMDCDIVFNVTGGRTPCKIGPILGFENPPAPPTLRMLFVGMAPIRMDIVEFDEEQGIVQTPLRVEQRTRLKDYLASYGIREVTRPERERSQKAMRDVASVAEQVLATYQGLVTVRNRDDMRAAIRNIATRAANCSHFPAELKLSGDNANFLKKHGIFKSLPGLKLSRSNLAIVQNKFAAEFISGKWLEAVIFSRLAKELKGKNDVEFGGGVKITLDNAETNEITDLDFLMLSDEKLDIVEAKAVTVTKRFREGIVRLAEYRNLLSGQAGQAWLVTPFLNRSDLEKDDMIGHAQRAGIEILFGENAVEELVDKILRT
ncbi:MAG: DUF1887 family protein [Marinosulfonomonas sp.]|nr:DUF1887 family protein [Marinosulfonomonas sp.]